MGDGRFVGKENSHEIRELVANALIHQDFTVTGAGPMIEIFDRRLEISNPGDPLVDTRRFLDTQPRSRNEKLASLMRRLNICEERGTGIDKVVDAVESFALPAPVFENPPGSTRALLFAHKPLREMDRQERLHACYMHACLRYVTQQPMTNSSLRTRFEIADRNASTASRILADAVDEGLIVVADPTAGPRLRRYLPFWAMRDPAVPSTQTPCETTPRHRAGVLRSRRTSGPLGRTSPRNHERRSSPPGRPRR